MEFKIQCENNIVYSHKDDSGIFISKTNIDTQETIIFLQSNWAEDSILEKISNDILKNNKQVNIEIFNNKVILKSFEGEFLEYKITQNQQEIGQYDLLEQLSFKVIKELYNF